ncbi:helix-turn-helix transcriptional regulator [Stigmatella aurantiaca]|uniref:helix-turn-helix transcriptional regulator n=1 Tax=Stigmatella aurantiaca TaxID=41 RepID=UPI00030EC9BF|nr:LuxR C-terminal-related transcriptional regulator [Stigmatella aurantiaca]
MYFATLAPGLPEIVTLDPSDAAIASLGVCSYTRNREELATDRSWYRSVIFNDHYRPAQINHYLLSHLHIPGYRAAHDVFLFKARSEGPFTGRERQIVHHLHEELGELWMAASQARLPRRLQQTLSLLQAGYSEKEVAGRLGISPGTVHDYCKALHKRWKVRSRAELLARTRVLPQAPQLMMQEQTGACLA